MRAVRPWPSPADLRSVGTAGVFEVSRFSCMKFLGVLWGLRLRQTEQRLALTSLPMLPSAITRASASGLHLFEAQYPPHLCLCLRFAESLAVAAQDSRPSGSLLLSRETLSFSTSCRLSGKAMARTGLRMMPTFPSPPLKFRTAGFPQYGFKAGLSEGAFPGRRPIVAPLWFASLLRAHRGQPVCPALSRGSCALGRCHSSHFSRSTPGVLAPVRVILSRSIYA